MSFIIAADPPVAAPMNFIDIDLSILVYVTRGIAPV
jgi:hypothetical protein